MNHDDIAEIVFHILRVARARGIHDPLRQAHAAAAALKLAELDHPEPHHRTHKPPTHGTEAGYRQHFRERTAPCDDCRTARNEADHRRKRSA